MHLITGRRLIRAGLLLGSVIGWALIALGAGLDNGVVIAIGAAAAGAVNVFCLKLTMESRSTTEAVAAAHRSFDTALKRQNAGLRLDVDAVQRTTIDAERRAEEMIGRLVAAEQDTAERLARLEHASEETRPQLARLEEANGTTVDALSLTRSMVDKLATRVPSAISASRLQALARQHLDRPLLSVAIPSFNRPDFLAECLVSLEREITNSFEDVVEVCIMDDASTDPDTIDVAAHFVERCRFASVRQQQANVGIERNVIAACQPCRGEYILLLGNDDVMVPGALATVLKDLRTVAAPVHLYNKTRITVEGKPRAPVPGSSPIDVPPGESHRFDTLLEAARRQGFISTFGFISHKVFRRAPFVAIDPAPYFDLTMYAQVFILVEAFAEAPVFYRNEPTVFHRTASQSHKRVEAIGRRESTFMSGGPAKEARYFGTTLAAAWQRLIDRKGFDTAFLTEQPENLMTTLRLLAWIARNRALDEAMDGALAPTIVADAQRFLAAFDPESVA